MTSTAVGKTGAPSGSTGKTEGRIIGVEPTRFQWAQTELIDQPKSDFRVIPTDCERAIRGLGRDVRLRRSGWRKC